METRKDFGRIIAPYEFFVNHSNERAADADKMIDEILSWSRQNSISVEKMRILDFGSGDGDFLAYLLQKMGSKALQVTVVDPVAEYRSKAIIKLANYSAQAVQAFKSSSELNAEEYDLIIANHVLYYVPDISDAVNSCLKARKKNGLFLITMATDENSLIKAWSRFFPSMGLKVPYHTETQLVGAFGKLGVSFEKKIIEASLEFEPTDENQITLTKFLLGENATKLSSSVRKEFFLPYTSNGNATMSVQDGLFVVR